MRGILLILGCACWTVTQAVAAAAEAPSFRNDVMAVLSKAGCNLGTCHGNKSGKGGLKISLRGDIPDFDYHVLTHDLSARRVNPADPDRSLMLLKPTMQVAHGGGRRFALDSQEYRILRNWIAAGMPKDDDAAPRLTALTVAPTDVIQTLPDSSVQLSAVAHFSDGTQRDVTSLAVYEPSHPIVTISHDGLVTTERSGEVTVVVRFLNQQRTSRLAFITDRPDFEFQPPEPRNDVDRFVFERLAALRINPAPICTDTTFVRRAYLDLLGILPTADEARAFLSSDEPDKRERLVDALLERPEFADVWALKWSDLLRNEEKTLDRKGVQNFHAWLREQFLTGRPLDKIAHDLIASRGSTYASPEANYYRALRDPITRGEATAQVFLGVRVQCAKCHNHPFDRWTQDDYYSWSNLFARVDYKILENNRRDSNDKHEFDGEQIVFMQSSGDVDDPRTNQPRPPIFLGAGTGPAAGADRLEALADWVASADNPFFARTQVNRIWQHLLGRGLVDPVDDMRLTNPASHPELLDWLTDDFVAHHFDLRHSIRTIASSAVYQLASAPSEANMELINSAHVQPRRLTAEQLLDAMSQVTGAPIRFSGYPRGIRAGELPGVRAVRLRDDPPTMADQFLVEFGKPPRLQSCDCERSDEPTLSQTFTMVSGPPTMELLTQPDNRIDRMLGAGRDEEQIVDTLFWAALSRPPTQDELAGTVRYIGSADNRRSAVEDVCWALMNSREFQLRL
jgi:Protein of unknown function (DUF1549)/Protein of unknown function (DUF1553)